MNLSKIPLKVLAPSPTDFERLGIAESNIREVLRNRACYSQMTRDDLSRAFDWVRYTREDFEEDRKIVGL